MAQDLYFSLGNRLDLQRRGSQGSAGVADRESRIGLRAGRYAFGLEENGEYGPAKSRALAALRADPRDVWAVHARTHVFEIEGKPGKA